MKQFVFLACLTLISLFGLGYSFSQSDNSDTYYFENLWDTYKNIDETEKALKDSSSKDVEVLKKASVFYFFCFVELGNDDIKVPKLNDKDKLEYLKKAIDIIEKANKLSKKNPEIKTLYGMMCLVYTGMVKDLSDIIKYSAKGVNSLELAKQLRPKNLDVLHLYVRSLYFYPTNIHNYTEALIETGNLFFEVYNSDLISKEIKDKYKITEQKNCIYMGNLYIRLKNIEKAREMYNKIDRNLIFKDGKTILNELEAELYEELEKGIKQ